MHVVATAGHVDHGKSSLVLALTGTDPDRFAEEKRRGLTIDLGFAHTTLASGAGISFIDVPGHVRFLRNMLAGVGDVDACLFVVAATERWKPQSEEHLRILELLDISHGVVALTKVDLVDDETRELAHLDIADHTAGTFLDHSEIIDVATPTGRGLEELRAALDRLVTMTPAAVDRGRPRLWIDRVFAAKGSGTVITGTLAGGELATDDTIDVVPLGRSVRIRALQTLGRAVERIGPGHRVAANLIGVDHNELERGHVLVRGAQWRPTSMFDASLSVLAALDHDVSRRGAYVIHVGSAEIPVRIRVLGQESLAPGATGLVRFHLPVALPLLPGDRFIVRESGRSETVGGGEVLDVAPMRAASRARPDRSVDRVIGERGFVDVDELEAITGVRRPADVGQWVVAPAVLAAQREALRTAVVAAGPLGLDLAPLDSRARAVAATLDDVVIENGRVRRVGQLDPFADHPFVARLLAGGLAPPDADGVDRAELRELARRGAVIELGGLWFHPSAVAEAARRMAEIIAAKPDGVTAGEARDAFGVTRKHAIPLLTELDARGITRRRGDLRIAGPRLPPLLA